MGKTTRDQLGYTIIKELLRFANECMNTERTPDKGTRIAVQFKMQAHQTAAGG